MKTKKYWLMKSEPDTYSIDDLRKDESTAWESVRNYQARNFMLHDMQVGDEVLFYHSSAEPSGIVGLAKVTAAAKPDRTQFDKKSDYYDEKSTKENPRWFCVDVGFVEKFKEVLDLELLRKQKALADMQVLKRGQRLSVQPVTAKEFECVLKLAKSSQA